MDPSTVGDVPLRWWVRWQMWGQASASRQSYLKGQRMDYGDLPPDDVSNITWARAEED
jgi:hypothetical protein